LTGSIPDFVQGAIRRRVGHVKFAVPLTCDGQMRQSLCPLAAAALLISVSAHADAYQPDSVEFLVEAKPHLCGIRADYQLTDGPIRVEVAAGRTGDAYSVISRAYQPNAVGPVMRDIWLQTDSLFTLGRFRAAKENSNGILEARGSLDLEEGKKFFDDLKKGNIEISLIFDGAIPAARFAVSLPSPLPSSVIADLDRCAT
jgi:hypothetical protein